ncbi:MAG TPA: large-conductance mechanosensitive channel protein MscL [Candidatus Pacearchaeota archaeon]|nr:large-conductance mechanosensitive channel protein MscL [Candidatus Parcubacteria bacterium]HOU45596.1 large-conductance mechanosensitive channel protein MscL [Candidatus Pacearchaeota archaeon]HPM08554.1 large-conductance mechanosensitive channel protein MscL [Candidatus Pacearchaeota archaeon]HQI74247.1 large-conductance mechanosensitive channel protein MscL [Candidatus Pacearchaeota archaeon]
MAKIKLLEEFKEFSMKGNVLDMAVGIIIGGAFGKVITSFVNDIFMPPLGIIIGGVNFSGLKFQVGELSINYGIFIQTVIDFLIVAFAIFFLIKTRNIIRRTEEKKEKTDKEKQLELLTEIRDALIRK